MSGVYWALTALELLGGLDEFLQSAEGCGTVKDGLVEFLFSCYDEEVGGFGGNEDQDPHLLYTLSAVQVLAMLGELERLDRDKVVEYVVSLQRERDGAFSGDQWGEVDSRFSYCALLTLRILGCPLRETVRDLDSAITFVLRCQNFDGGFGCIPGAESHAGQIFCCVGALALSGQLKRIDAEKLGWWLCQRQLPCGGFNGRPDKTEDVCYSWWVLASLVIIGKQSWIDGKALSDFILRCQDSEEGGVADRPGDVADVFHTYFGVAGLSLLQHPDVTPIDPMFALPVTTLESLKLS
uniref:Geranylgeranyl transferase type-2 subunit beta n=1 Tax=Compsopogon caeruleus TaxID=31354 RepID=A0A7S1XAH0_9RHOD